LIQTAVEGGSADEDVTLTERPQPRKQVREPFIVGVEESYPGLTGMRDPGVTRGTFALVNVMHDDASSRRRRSISCPIRRTVIDDNHFCRGPWPLAERASDRADDHLRAVVRGYHYGHGQGRAGRFLAPGPHVSVHDPPGARSIDHSAR
jgi:hypothetical protein